MQFRIFVVALPLLGCAPRSNDLEARLHALEAEVAALKATVVLHGRIDPAPSPDDVVEQSTKAMKLATAAGCKDVSIPTGTQIDVPVAFDLGASTTKNGDRITIKEIVGTRADFALGGVYLVRGEYTLASGPEATLALGVGATDPRDACTMNNTRGRLHVVRGTGTFELATTFVHRGRPGISFYVEGVDGTGGAFHGPGSGGVRFGKGDFPAQ
jgi:hypothetical protein